MTIVTAIVSPTALPSPSNVAPNNPDLASDKIILDVSQRVAPSANAASRCAVGIAFRTSREIDVIIGRIMIARINPAASIPNPYGAPLNNGRNFKFLDNKGSTDIRSQGTRTKMPTIRRRYWGLQRGVQ